MPETYRASRHFTKAVLHHSIPIYVLHFTLILAFSLQSAPLLLGNLVIPENRVIYDAANQLIALNLRGMGLKGESFLENITPYAHSIQTLDLSDNRFTKLDLSPLKEAINLFSFDLSCNKIKEVNLTSLGGLSNLALLNLSGNRIEKIDLHPLSECSKLRILYLHQNRISQIDLEPLTFCENLKTLWLYNNSLREFCAEILKKMKYLEELRINGNCLTDECLAKLKECFKTSDNIQIIF
ncbi:leucine-rich repeat protein [bacterium]|nr:leucine-rich repeat protein [bacterium]